MAPRTRYARSGELSIAYQVVGDGPVDLVHAPGSISHVEYHWEEPGVRPLPAPVGGLLPPHPLR